MSEKIDIIVDSSTDVESGNEIVSASTDNNIDIEILEPDYDITINKREYVITGDNLYIPKTYDESPQWLKDIIGTITDFSLNQKLTEIGALSNTLYVLIDELEVAKNTYTQSIITSAEIDEIINARIETLNSSLSGSDATIVDLIATKATPTEASSLALNVLTASINDGAISSLVSNLQNAISTSTSNLANNIDIVHAEMTGEFNANAEVVNAIETSVTNINGTLSSHAGQITNLQTSASAVDGKIATANSSVINTVNTTIANGDALVTSKWAYNSTLNIGGNSYNSGFGLSNSSGTGVGSEFWINADKFKFTNNAKSGNKAPFSIDASGATPEIYFNGRVQFSNITGYTPPDVSGSINSNNDIFAQKLGYLNYSAMVAAATSGQTIITGGHVNTNLINAGAINAGMINTAGLIAENISANEIVGKTMTGGIINGAAINGAVIKASYLDLDGELEVLTNYHITAAMYAANPSLYTDAIYLSASNEYRIPSMSVVREETKIIQMNTVGTVYNSKIRSYNCGNIGHNLKAVKVRPIVYASNISIEITLPALVLGSDWSKSKESTLYFCGQLVGSFFFRNKVREDAWGNAVNWYIELYFNNSLVYSFYDKISIDTNGEAVPGSLSDPSFSGTFTAFGITIGFNVEWEKVTLYILHESFTPTVDYSNTSESLFKVVTSGEQIISSIWYNSTVVANFSSSTYINNMI